MLKYFVKFRFSIFQQQQNDYNSELTAPISKVLSSKSSLESYTGFANKIDVFAENFKYGIC